MYAGPKVGLRLVEGSFIHIRLITIQYCLPLRAHCQGLGPWQDKGRAVEGLVQENSGGLLAAVGAPRPPRQRGPSF